MPLPTCSEIELPLLVELYKLGGKARPVELYPRVARHFPQLTEEDLARRSARNPSKKLWPNRVQWTRQGLVEKGELDGSERGIWKITPAGVERLRAAGLLESEEPESTPPPEPRRPLASATLRDLVRHHEEEIRGELLQRLTQMKPAEFERFSKRLLEALGFENVEVTQVSRDGGIDGHGQLQMGVVKVKAAFQCKRWQGSVPRPEIDRFRGAISGQFDQGIFITTSSFTREAMEQSVRQGAVPIVMIDGERIVDLMIRHRIGVQTHPITIMEIDNDFFQGGADIDESEHPTTS